MSIKYDNWWLEFFPAFRPFFSKKTSETKDEVSFIIKHLNLKSGSTLLDCPCGIGRVSIPLAKKGIKVSGVDITTSYLAELEEKSSTQKLPIKLYLEDMRKINFENEFDAAINLWTSLGYFEKDSDNDKVIKKTFKALKPGGKFILQVINRDWIMRIFQKNSWMQEGEYKLLTEREFDLNTSRMIERWTFIGNGEEKAVDTNIRLYSCHELIAMFKKEGFIEIESYGNTKGEAVSMDRNNLYIIGSKPK